MEFYKLLLLIFYIQIELLYKYSTMEHSMNLFEIPLTEQEKRIAEMKRHRFLSRRPNIRLLTVAQMCSLPPDKGTGTKNDIIRIYYNPTVQQCLPFSWSGQGGNANRFVSIKNCYEVCHPADPGVRTMTASGIRSYLVNRPSSIKFSQGQANSNEFSDAKDVVVRKIKNPIDPSKTLTIVQPVKYVNLNSKVLIISTTTTTEKPEIVIEKRIVHGPIPYYKYDYLNQPPQQYSSQMTYSALPAGCSL